MKHGIIPTNDRITFIWWCCVQGHENVYELFVGVDVTFLLHGHYRNFNAEG